MTTVAIALGSNVGDRQNFLREAARRLDRLISLTAFSPVYETAPMYVEEQDAFLNAVVLGQTELGPLSLLAQLKEVEREIGRTTALRYGPRTIDLDLIAYGALWYRFYAEGEERLAIPHPRTFERGFVLRPLAAVAPEMALPGLGTVAELLRTLDAQKPSSENVHGVLSL